MLSSLYSLGSEAFENARHSLSASFSSDCKPKVRFDYKSGYSVIVSIDINTKALAVTRIDGDSIDFREIGIPVRCIDKFTIVPRGFYFFLHLPGMEKSVSILNPHHEQDLQSIYVEEAHVSFEDVNFEISGTSAIISCLAKIANANQCKDQANFLKGLNQFGYYRYELYDDEVFYWYPLCSVCLAATPKCASTTVLALFSDDYVLKRGLDYTWRHLDAHGHGNLKGLMHLGELADEQIYRILTRDMDNNANVALVRHPLSRLVSAYLDKVVSRSSLYHVINNILIRMGRSVSAEDICFDDFVEALATVKPVDFEPHIKPIAMTVHPRLVKYSHIIKVESLSSDLKRLSSDVGLHATPRASARLHQTSSLAADVTISSRSRELVEKIYSLDYEAFDY
jgi:hypothetical protein